LSSVRIEYAAGRLFHITYFEIQYVVCMFSAG